MQHGKGVEIWVEGTMYEGDYVMGMKDGIGEYSFPDGSRYCG